MDEGTLLLIRFTVVDALILAFTVFLTLKVAPRFYHAFYKKQLVDDYDELLRPRFNKDLEAILRAADDRITKGRAQLEAQLREQSSQLEQRSVELQKAGAPISAAAAALGQASGEARASAKLQAMEAEASFVEQFGEGWVLFKKMMPTEAREFVKMGDGAVPIIAKWLAGLRSRDAAGGNGSPTPTNGHVNIKPWS